MSPTSRILPLVVASALFMENMDSTVIATSLPAIARDLNTDPVALKLAFTTYLLSLTIFLPISSWISDRFGARRVFRLAILVFTLASLACGAAPSLGWLVFARAVQGLGGAMMVPVGRIILLRSIPKSELVSALAWLTIPALVGPLLGPPVGGFITTYFSWHWIFWMNLPFGIIGIVMATLFMSETREENVPPLDVTGFLLSGSGLAAFVFGITIAGRSLIDLRDVIGLIVLGAILMAFYVRHAARVPNPILDLKLLRVQTLRISVGAGTFYRLSAGAMPFLLPLMLQIGFDMTPFQSGMITCASALGALLMKFAASRLLKRFGYRQLLLINGLVSCALMAVNGFFTNQTPLMLIFVILVIGGLSRSMQFTSLNSIAYADISNKDIARANGIYTVMQQLSLTLGVTSAAVALDLSQYLRGGATDLIPSDFSFAFFVVAAAGLLAIPQFYRLPANAGESMSGHKA
jgi:EmrB/QacA subfamily drug resistance transporter